jgi:hypothetical protein
MPSAPTRFGANLVAHTKEGDGCLNILDPVGGIFEPSRAAALASK